VKLLDKVRIINMYMLIFTLLFILQKYTIGLIPHIEQITLFNKFYFYEILFAFNAVIFIRLFVKVGTPKRY